ncbi:MAG: hypothetical protein AAGC44_03165 [Planctomycetota bacterium]
MNNLPMLLASAIFATVGCHPVFAGEAEHDLQVQAVGVRYVDKDQGAVSRFIEGPDGVHSGIAFYSSRFAPDDKADLYLLLTPTDEQTYVTDLRHDHGEILSAIDSTGKDLLVRDGQREAARALDGAIQGLIGDETAQPYRISGLAIPSENAQYITVTGTLHAMVSSTKVTVRTSPGVLGVGNIFQSEEVEVRVRKLGTSTNLELFRPDLIDQYATQMQVVFKPAEGSERPITDPGMRNCYTWRFMDEDATAHRLKSAFSGGTSWADGRDPHWVRVKARTDLYAEAVLTHGHFEFEFWTEFERVEVPFEVAIPLREFLQASRD